MYVSSFVCSDIRQSSNDMSHPYSMLCNLYKIFIASFNFFWFWSIPSRGRRIFVFHMGDNKKWNQHIGFFILMFVYGNEFQHLEIEFKPKLLVISYLSIKKSLQKQIQ